MGNSEEEHGFIPLDFEEFPQDEMIERARSFFNQMSRRRTTRHFSDREVPKEMIELAIKTASTAPSGAHLQPWTFVAISDEELRTKIRVEAEKEESLLIKFKTYNLIVNIDTTGFFQKKLLIFMILSVMKVYL